MIDLDELGSTLRAALATGDLVPGDALPEMAIGAQRPAWIARPGSVGELQACLRAMHAAGAATVPVGVNARPHVGHAPRRFDIALSTRRLQRVLAHEADDMTVVVEAGATLAEVDAVLRPHGQRLAIDAPWPDRTTIGGLIAGDVWGPLRAAHGRVRDHLLGVHVVLADGTSVKGGGRVVKNVAGYDLMKLMCGSHGTLGVIHQAAFRLRPRPACTRIGVVGPAHVRDGFAAAMRLTEAAVTPAFVRMASGISGLGDRDGDVALVIGLEGSVVEVDAMAGRVEALLGREPRWLAGDEARHVYESVRDAQEPSSTEMLVVRVGVRPPDLARLVDVVCGEDRGSEVDVRVAADPIAGAAFFALSGAVEAVAHRAGVARERAVAAGGFAVFHVVDETLRERSDAWGEVGAVEWMRAIKAALDPSGCLSPGRFVGGI